MVSSLLTDAVVVVIVLGLMILVHELGHFLAAKGFGVRVLVFSLGFGKRLFGMKRGDTDYRVSLLPFGGYVKMAGDDPSEARNGDPGEFLAKPRWKRFVIVGMGPAMNVFMAVVLLMGLYHFHFEKPGYEERPARLGDVDADSPAARAGLSPGDLIVRFGGIQNPKWEDVELKTLMSVGETIPLEAERDRREFTATLAPKAEGPNRVGYAGLYPFIPSVIDKVEPGLPASQAGLKPGDEIVAINGRRSFFYPRLAYLLQLGKGNPIDLTVRHDAREFSVSLKPVYSEVGAENRWRIGVAFHNDVVIQKLPWGSAAVASLRENSRNCMMTFDVLTKIVTRRMSARSLSGPIGIAQLSGEAYRAGIPELLVLITFISLQLGIFNLLPIPILDGGVILLLIIEGLIGRDLSLQVKERVVQVGMVFLLLLAVFVMYSDIVKTLRPS